MKFHASLGMLFCLLILSVGWPLLVAEAQDGQVQDQEPQEQQQEAEEEQEAQQEEARPIGRLPPMLEEENGETPVGISERFIPSEQISQDLGVSFPADI